MNKLLHYIDSIQSGVWGEEEKNDINDVKCLRVADFKYENLSYQEPETIRNISDKNKYLLKKGDILIEKSGGGEKTTVGRAVFVDRDSDFVYANFIDRLRPKNSNHGKFLTYFLACLYARQINTKYIKQNTGIQNLDLHGYLREEVKFPPESIWEKIVQFLDQKVARIDEAIAKKKKLISLLEEKRISTIQKNIYRHGAEKRKLKFIASLVYGDSLPNEVRDEEGRIPVYGSFGQVGLHNKANTKRPVLIVGRKGSYGKVMYSEVPVFVIDTAYFIDPATSKCSLRWLYYVLRVVDFQGSSLDTGVPGLSREFAHNYEIPYYGKTEQEKIASDLDKKMQSFDNVQNSIKKSIEILEEYKTSLISNAVTGKVKI